MKTRKLLLVLSVLLVAGGLWAGRLAWRAHHQLVTLDVREASLRDVLRKIESQTWTRIRAEESLQSVRVTLHVANQPLGEVLTRLAEQAGARWSTLYAVYDSKSALKKLESALGGDGKLEPAGWTRIAPKFPEPDKVDGEQPEPAVGAGPPPDGAGPRRMMMFRRGPDGPVAFMGGPKSQVEMWSPEEVVMAQALSARLGDERKPIATAGEAAAIAHEMNGKWTTYLAFRKSSMGVGFSAMPPGPPGSGPSLRGPNPNARFANLTPEQRVKRARERRGLRPEPE